MIDLVARTGPPGFSTFYFTGGGLALRVSGAQLVAGIDGRVYTGPGGSRVLPRGSRASRDMNVEARRLFEEAWDALPHHLPEDQS